MAVMLPTLLLPLSVTHLVRFLLDCSVFLSVLYLLVMIMCDRLEKLNLKSLHTLRAYLGVRLSVQLQVPVMSPSTSSVHFHPCLSFMIIVDRNENKK